MNAARFILALAVVIVTVMATNFVFHNIYLTESYQATAQIWRPESSMEAFMGFMMAGQLLVALGFTLLYTRTAEHTVMNGVIFGLFIGIMAAGTSTIYYAVLPIPMDMLGKWIAFNLLQGILLGTLVGLIYRR